MLGFVAIQLSVCVCQHLHIAQCYDRCLMMGRPSSHSKRMKRQKQKVRRKLVFSERQCSMGYKEPAATSVD